MLHRALLKSHDSADVYDVLLDVSGTDVEMFVDETSVGKWSVEQFIGEPQDKGYQLRVDGERWIVAPRDRPLFEADTVLRTPRVSQARFANRHRRISTLLSELRRSTTRRLVMWYLVLVAMSVGSFGFGVIVGRYRVDGDNVFTWGLIGVLAAISILLGRALTAAASEHREPLGTSEPPALAEPRVDAVSRLLSTLQFQAPSSEPQLDESPPEHHPLPPEEVLGDPVVTIDLTSIEAVPDESARETDSRAEETEKLDTQTEDTQTEEFAEPVVDRGRVRLPIHSGLPPAIPRERGRRQDREDDRVVVLNLESTDDLTTIHGIGPAFAAVLGEIGIHSYQQLASIDGATLAALRTRLGPLASRIERDRWIESAAAAYRAKLNERRRDAVSM
ncbi:MAG TPA: hypothetical protein VMS74_02735 [Acidimicrobiia bacterium]|nr:hypothetical protein [Acidimicrobiia bacterium]